MRAEVQNPQACLLSCELKMEEVFVDVAVIQQVTLLNQTLLPATFEWGEVKESLILQCDRFFQNAHKRHR